MVDFIGTGSGQVIRGYNTVDDCYATLTPAITVISAGGSSTISINDSSYSQETTATYDTAFTTSISNAIGYPAPTVNNLTPGIISLDSNYTATRITDGTAQIQTIAQQGTRNYSMPISRTIGATTNTFLNYVSGSLARALVDNINTSIAAKTPSSTTQNIISSGATRNSSLFCASYDISSFSIGGTGGSNTNVCLVTPQHFIAAAHAATEAPGIQVIWYDSSGNSYTRTVTHGSVVPGTDISVAKLDSALPAGVVPAKVLPSNYTSYLPTPANGLPVIAGTGQRSICITQIFAFGSTNMSVQRPTNVSQDPWNFKTPAGARVPTGGDSGSPIYALIGSEAVLLGTWETSNSCSNVAANYSAINTLISTTLGGGSAYTLTSVSLGGYATY